MIVRYSSTAALRAAYLDRCKPERHEMNRRDSWYGDDTLAETLGKAEVGDTSLVPQAEAALTKLDTAIETTRRMWEPNVAGAYCCVPDAIVGRPTSMRRMVHVRDETSPITILAVTTSSAGISAKTLAERGVTILALVMALSRIRPVVLQQLTILDGDKDGETVITSEINTHPLDLATACYVLTSAGFARRLTYDLARKLNRFRGGWPATFSYSKPERYYAALAPKLVADPSRCLIIGAAQLGDQLLREPIEWINQQIQRFTSSQEEG